MRATYGVRDHRHRPLRARAPVTNDDLSRVMDTNDDWIFQRSGIRQRHFAPEGSGCERLRASRRASAPSRPRGSRPNEIDYVVFATMTPEYVFPGLGRAARAQARASRACPRSTSASSARRCSSACRSSTASSRAAPRRPSSSSAPRRTPASCPGRTGTRSTRPVAQTATPEQRERANKHRALAILFGDGAGALLFRATDRDAGLRGMKLHTDGGAAKLLYVEGGGFRTRPYWKHTDFDEQKYIPTMDGRELFKFAVTKLPQSRARALRRDEDAARARSTGFSRTRRTRASTTTCASSSACPREAAVEHRALRQHERRDDP